MSDSSDTSWYRGEWLKCTGKTAVTLTAEQFEAHWQQIFALAYIDLTWQVSIANARLVCKDGYASAWSLGDYGLAYERTRLVREHPDFSDFIASSHLKLLSVLRDEASALLAMDDLDRGIEKCREILGSGSDQRGSRNIVFSVIQKSVTGREEALVPKKLVEFVCESITPIGVRAMPYSHLLDDLTVALELKGG